MQLFKAFEELKSSLVLTLKSIGLDDLASVATDEDLDSICASYIGIEGVLLLSPKEMHVELLKGVVLSVLSYARINHGLDGPDLFLR